MSEAVAEDDMAPLRLEEGDEECKDPCREIQVTAKVEPLDEPQRVDLAENENDNSDGEANQGMEQHKAKEVLNTEEDDVEKNVAKLLNEEQDDKAESQHSEDVQSEDSQDNVASQNNESEKEESEEFHAEYLDENAIKKELLDLPDEYEVEFLEDEEMLDETFFQDENNEIEKEYILPSYKVRSRRRKKNGEYISVAEQLREKYPELRHNTEKLVQELAEIMRQAKPPPPPPNYYKIVVESATKYQYECSYCGKKRPTLPLAARHYQFSHGEDYLTCLACGSRHRNTTNLYKHEKRCSAPDGALVLRARGHYLGRKGRGRPYTTDNKFITYHSRTIKQVKGQRLFCSKCPASFAHRENLEAHEFSHEGVRPFHCVQCPARYTSAPALRRHYLAMHGDQQYICDHCGDTFKLKPLLVSHMNSHRAVRKHPCLYCERRFAQKVALRHHMNKVHLNLPAAHGCPLCHKRYPRMTQVKEHVARTHGLTMITRRMYYQSLPRLPQEALQVTLQPSIVNHRLKNQPDKTRRYIKPIPDYKKKIPNEAVIKQEVEEIFPDLPLQEYVELDLRDTNDDAFISYVVIKDGVTSKVVVDDKEEDLASKILTDETEKEVHEDNTEGILTEEILTEEDVPNVLEHVSNVPQILNTSQRKKRQLSPPPIDDASKIEIFDTTIEFRSKREKKEKKSIIKTEPRTTDETINKVERVIKSAIKQKLEVKRPEPAKTLPVTAVLKPIIQTTAEDEEDWKEYKARSAKDHVVAEFLEYMRSKKVPPKVYPVSVPILRKKIGPQPEPAGPSKWLESTREKIVTETDSDEEVTPSVDIPEVIEKQ